MGTENVDELSDREQEILRLVATGASNKEIASKLSISPNTVKVHLRNIFSKIGVASRTEATLYSIRTGLSDMPGGDRPAAPDGALAEANGTDAAARPLWPSTARSSRRPWRWAALIVIGLVGGALGLSLLIGPRLPTGAPPTAGPAEVQGWAVRAALLTARSQFAATAHNDRIYLIAGEALTGVTGVVEQYDPETDRWMTMSDKPTPVADVRAAVVGGRIYVPGGRLSSGAITDSVEVFDPSSNVWERAASLPLALSQYALAAWEGRIYLFGGWDGRRYSSAAYVYEPAGDQWRRLPDMPTARGGAAAAVVNGRFYVMGGTLGAAPLSVSETFMPSSGGAADGIWSSAPPMPAGRNKLGAATLGDLIYVLGGESLDQPLGTQIFSPRDQAWQQLAATANEPSWPQVGLISLGTDLHAFGGQQADGPTDAHRMYRVFYQVLLPIITN